MSSIKTEPIACPQTILGEGPHWDIKSQSLYFVDIVKTELPLHRYDYAEKKTYSAKLVGVAGTPYVSAIIPVDGEANHFAVTMNRKVGVVQWDGKSKEATVVRTAASVEEQSGFEDNRINDTKADPTGRLYFGTMCHAPDGWKQNTGSLYKYAKGEQICKLFDGIAVANGLCWNLDRNKFYYIDSLKFNITQFDYDSSTGNISNREVLIDFCANGPNPGYIPDGMTIDRDGFIYTAMFGGFKVVKVDPNNGNIVLEIPLPVEQITSVAFGGPNLDILFVTSASWAHDKKKQNFPDSAGKVFQVTGPGIGVGLPMNNVRI